MSNVADDLFSTLPDVRVEVKTSVPSRRVPLICGL